VTADTRRRIEAFMLGVSVGVWIALLLIKAVGT